MRAGLRRFRESDFVLVLGFELRRVLGANPRRFVLRVGYGVALGALIVGAIDEWLHPYFSWMVAFYLQPAGLGPQLPDVHSLETLRMWAVWGGYLAFSWCVCFLLLWGRLYIATRTAASVNEQRRSGHDEMMTIAPLARAQSLLGQMLAPALPPIALATLLIAALSGVCTSGGASWLVPLRVWFDVTLQFMAVAALCRGVALRFQRPGPALTACLAAGLLGVSVTMGLQLLVTRLALKFGWHGYADATSGIGGSPYIRVFENFSSFPFANLSFVCHLAALATLVGCGVVLAAGRARRGVLRATMSTLPLFATALLAATSFQDLSKRQDKDAPESALAAAGNALALRDAEAALRALPSSRSDDRPKLRIMRILALFERGDFDAATRECQQLTPIAMNEGWWTGLAACHLAAGRPALARESLRFAEAMGARMHGRIRSRREVCAQIAQGLPRGSYAEGPIRITFLRWAHRRFPHDEDMRKELTEELLLLANGNKPSNSNPADLPPAPPAVRRALLREAESLQ